MYPGTTGPLHKCDIIVTSWADSQWDGPKIGSVATWLALCWLSAALCFHSILESVLRVPVLAPGTPSVLTAAYCEEMCRETPSVLSFL